jgi:carboxymethylenebutenolidase
MLAETVRVRGHGGDPIAAYFARPLGPGPFGGVVVIHHMPGWDDATKEITRRFAGHGYAAICPHLHYREGSEESPNAAAVASRAHGGVPDERFLADAAAAIEYVRRLPYANGKVGVIGYCSGGRQAFLAACHLELDAAIDCYGGFVIEYLPDAVAVQMRPIIDRAPSLRCPLLGLFGEEDVHPSPSETRQLAEVLTNHGKTFEFHTFEAAGHAFFAADRPTYRVAAANEGWKHVLGWFERYLAS